MGLCVSDLKPEGGSSDVRLAVAMLSTRSKYEARSTAVVFFSREWMLLSKSACLCVRVYELLLNDGLVHGSSLQKHLL